MRLATVFCFLSPLITESHSNSRILPFSPHSTGELIEWPLLLDPKHKYKEKVTLELTFDDGAISSEEFDVSPTNGFVFLQTDKPIYRVSEPVRFRILRLDRSLSPINEKVILKVQVFSDDFMAMQSFANYFDQFL